MYGHKYNQIIFKDTIKLSQLSSSQTKEMR